MVVVILIAAAVGSMVVGADSMVAVVVDSMVAAHTAAEVALTAGVAGAEHSISRCRFDDTSYSG